MTVDRLQTKQIVILAPDFKPMLGGVAEYTFGIAKFLNKLNCLDRVITPVPQQENYEFKVNAPFQISSRSKNIFFQKFYSLSYLLQLKWLDFLVSTSFIVKRHRVFPILNWLTSPLAQRWIQILHAFDIPYGVIFHGKDIIVANKNDSALVSRVCQKASLVIFNSYATRNLLNHLKLQVAKDSYILYPGIDTNILDKYELLAINELETFLQVNLKGKLVISTVCRLVERKGIDIAIKAIEPLLKHNKNLVYLIVGNGEEYSSLACLINQLGISEQVKLIGSVDNVMKYSILDKSSIFLMPNHLNSGDDFEGFGISFIEASYFNNVTIGGRSGGAVEAIKEGVNGFLVDTNASSRVDNLRTIIADLIAQPEEIERIGKAAKAYVTQNFQVEYLVHAFVKYLDKINL